MTLKTFKEHLILTESSARNPFGLLMDSRRFYIPLASKTIQRAFGEIPKIIAYHRTDIGGLKKLKGIQNTAKSISTSTIFTKGINLFAGVVTKGGVIVQVEGKMLLNSDHDAYSVLDSQGRRWFDAADNMSPNDIKDKNLVLLKAIQTMLNSDPNVNKLPESLSKIIKTQLVSGLYDYYVFFASLKFEIENGRYSPSELPALVKDFDVESYRANIPLINKIKARILSLAIAITEKYFLKYIKNHYSNLSRNADNPPILKSGLFELGGSIDELVINHFKILKVAIALEPKNGYSYGLIKPEEMFSDEIMKLTSGMKVIYMDYDDPKTLEKLKGFFKTR